MTVERAVGPYGRCASLTQAFIRNETHAGVTVSYIPYAQCRQHCPGWRRYSAGQIVMVLSQFILPAAIFAFLLPRTKYLVFPFRFDLRRLANGRARPIWALKGFLAAAAEGLISLVVAVLDMMFWISLLMTIPGPILWEVVSESLLDYRIMTSLTRTRNPELRLELNLALLCGSFSYDHATTSETRRRVKNAFKQVLNNRPGQASAYLSALMDSQTPFASTVGIPTLFFLSGFLYNTLTMNDLTAAGYNWTPYAIWLMLMVFIAVASTSSATGTNPSVLEPLLHTTGENEYVVIKGWRRYIKLASFYPGKLQPVSIWNRGARKSEWLLESELASDPEFPQDLSPLRWFGVGLIVTILTSFPTLMAFFMAHILPWPHYGCRSISYITYGVIQFILIVATAFRIRLEILPIETESWLKKLLKLLFIGGSLVISFLLAFLGSIFQIFGVYNNCLCRTDPSTWGRATADMWTTLGITGETTTEYDAWSQSFALRMTLTAVAIVAAVCFLAWWYQKTMYSSVRKEVEKLEDEAVHTDRPRPLELSTLL